jgi:hypothetical protein
VSAVRALYRCCHLPAPVVLVPRSAVDFARVTAIVARGSNADAFTRCSLVALSSLTLVLAMIDWIEWERSETAPPLLGVAIMSYLGVMGVGFAAWYFGSMARPRTSAWDLVLIYGTGCLVGLLTGVVAAVDWTVLVSTTVMGAAGAVLLHAGASLCRPPAARLAVGRRFGVAVPLRGSQSIHEAMRSRLRAALEQLLASPRPTRSSPRGAPAEAAAPDRRDAAARLDAEGRRLTGFRWYDLRPLLGDGAGGLERAQMERTTRLAREPEDLPAMLRAALLLHGAAEAVTLLEDVAIVLPKSAPVESHAPPSDARTFRRSARSPYREAFFVMGGALALRLAVDLAGSDHLADRILARAVVRVEDRVIRHALIRALGIERFVEAGRISPVQTDQAGALYVIGPAQDPLAFVRVEADPDGPAAARAHWLSVPSHVASAREGLAWAFGLSERSYYPADEA